MVATLIQWLTSLGTLVALLVVASGPVAAHAELATTSPEDGAELDAAPDEVVLVFDGELDPESSGFVVTDAGGAEVGRGEVDLEVAERNELRGPVDIDGPGEYTVSWSIAAADGHPGEGSYTFTVRHPQAPDTSLPGAGPGPLVLLGSALLLAGSLLAAVRMARRRSAR